MKPAIEIRDVTKIYELAGSKIKAVDGVSLTVQAGEFTALVGPSGSGKTTMLAILAGLLRPNSGQVIIDQQDLTLMTEAKRTSFRCRYLGFIFQASNLVPYLTALENVELMLKLNSKTNQANHERAKNLLIRLGLGERLHNLPGQLSGGQQQRVAIARALVHEPTVVLADEPTASLDTERAHQVVETFAALIHEQGRAGIMVTHDLRMCQYVDQIIQMTDGKITRLINNRAEITALAKGK